jgi:hypothetical protein
MASVDTMKPREVVVAETESRINQLEASKAGMEAILNEIES